MKTSFTKLVAIFTVSVATVAATSSLAYGGGGGKKGGGFGIGYSNGNFGVGVKLGGNNNKNYNGKLVNNGGYNNGGCHTGGYGGTYNNGGGYNPNGGVYSQNGGVYGQAYEPLHSTYIVQPFDSLYLVSQREYGNSVALPYIAKFNNLPVEAALTPGQRLVLPSISATGQLSQSRRPAAENDTTPFTTPNPTANSTSPLTSAVANLASTAKAAATEPALPKVTVGSTLVLDGQTFGEERGIARLRVSGLSLPVEVLEWTSTSTKVRLPQVELTSPTKVEIEVLRADGSLAAKSAIELTPAADRFALGN